MTLPLTESFGAAAGVLANPPWTQQALSATTLNYDGSGSGKASAADSVKGVYVFDNANTYSNDQYAQVTVTSGLASGLNHADVLVRASGTGAAGGNHYVFKTDGATGATHTDLSVRILGALTALTSFATTFTSGDIMRIEVRGTVIVCYKNGVSLGSYDTVSDANKLSSGAAGCGVFNSSANNVLIDNWEGGNMPAGNAPMLGSLFVGPNSGGIPA